MGWSALQNFYQILLVFFRADPSVVPDGKTEADFCRETPIQIAVSEDLSAVLDILKEFTELPDNVKLVQLSKLMCSSGDVEKSKEEFQDLLHSLPLDLVSSDHSLQGDQVGHNLLPTAAGVKDAKS